jgi:hypothetical protein
VREPRLHLPFCGNGDEGTVVEVETTIAADRNTVWRAMTRTNTAMLPGAEIETDWVVGRPIRLSANGRASRSMTAVK